MASKPVVDFLKPDTVVSISIDPETGYPATSDCPEKQDEFYISGSEPSGSCPKHGGTGLNQLFPPPPPSNAAGQPEPDLERSETVPLD
jgi:membrane carboxypeptidase/penicillin-binding protein